ncbi:uncharacterized protein [Anabrus simplex]|uniref:uncharacterized protein n=1 Tax=Anabrus simplex TaxID=316456 RepID=UPI0034DD9E8A
MRLYGLVGVVLLLLLTQVSCSSGRALNVSAEDRKLAIQAWRAFLKEPRSGVDLVLDSIKSYPDGDKVLGSLSRETGLSVNELDKAVEPLGTNLLINYSKIFAMLRDENKMKIYMQRMGKFYHEKSITEQEYMTLNGLISQHVKSKLKGKYPEHQLDAVGRVLDAIKKGIFNS